MARDVVIFAIFVFVGLAYLIHGALPLMTLLVKDGSNDIIHYGEVDHVGSNISELIPRIIHQTYKSANVPEVWVDFQRSCIDMHPGYKYIVRICVHTRDCFYVDNSPADLHALRSCGQTKAREALSPKGFLGFCKHSTLIHTLSNELMLSAILP